MYNSDINVKTYDKFWFEVDKKEVPQYLFSTVRELLARQNYKEQQDLRNFKLYSNQKTDGFKIHNYTSQSQSNGLVLNVIQSITDTLVAKIGKNKPKVTFLTDDGDWSMRKKAEKLEMFIQGQFYKAKVYQTTPRILKRSCVFGTGFGQVYSENKEICFDNVFPGEIIVDDREAIDGTTKTFYRIKYVSKVVLKKLYPEYEKEIELAGEVDDGHTYLNKDTFYASWMVPVIEAWRLPSRKKAKDGRHIISLSNIALLDETWERDYHPFPMLKFSEKLLGFWGVGVAELLAGIQNEINNVIKRVSQSIHINSVPRIFYEYNSKLNKEYFNNDIGTCIPYKNTPPMIHVGPSVASDVFNHLDRLYQRAFEIVGVSQMSAIAQKPAGLNAAVAIRESHDIETERFSTLQSAYDDAHLEIARQFIDEAKDIAKKDRNFAVITKSQEGTLTIKWKDVEMDEDSYIMQMYPTNLLPQQPSAKMEKVIELTNAGLFSKEEGTILLDFPDVKSITKLKTAKLDDIMLTIREMLDNGDYLPPEDYQDLMLGIEYCQSFYLMYKRQKVPQERLDLLTRWISDAQKKLAKAQQAMSMMSAPQQPPQPALPLPNSQMPSQVGGL